MLKINAGVIKTKDKTKSLWMCLMVIRIAKEEIF